MATWATLNTNTQNQCGAQLRTFDKTMTLTVTAYIRVYGTDSAYGAAMASQNGPTSSGGYNHRFEAVNAAYSTFASDLDSGIYTGARIYSQDVIDSITRACQGAVNHIEGRITNRSVSALLCHNSCHSSCHTSRGRR